MFSGDKALTASGSAVPAETAKETAAANYWDAIGVTIEPAAASSASGTGTTPPASPTTPPAVPPTTGPGVTAVSANDFLNSLGVNIHPTSNNGSPPAQYAPLINYVGVRHTRGYDAASDIINISKLTNTTSIYELDSGGNRTSVSGDIATAKTVAQAGFLLAVEGSNEPNNWPVTYQGQVGGGTGTWLPVAKLQRDLYAATKADSTLKNYPVFNITGSGAETDNVGLQFLTIPNGSGLSMPDGTVYADFANQHNYVIWNGAAAPVDNIAWNNADPVNQIAPVQDSLSNDYGVTWLKGYAGYSKSQLATLARVTTETGWWDQSGGQDQPG